MSIWLRGGPFKVSSRGRVGVRVGPVSAYAGGRHRRSSSSGGGMVLLGIFALAVVLAIAVKYWYIAVPFLILIVAVVIAGAKGQAEKAAAQAAADEQARVEAQREWLQRPPPVLYLPGRFTENWFAANVPGLHPSQVPVLLEELHERGWTDERIEKRVRPYLLRNPYYVHR
jgi:hypothetical protein